MCLALAERTFGWTCRCLSACYLHPANERFWRCRLAEVTSHQPSAQALPSTLDLEQCPRTHKALACLAGTDAANVVQVQFKG